MRPRRSFLARIAQYRDDGPVVSSIQVSQILGKPPRYAVHALGIARLMSDEKPLFAINDLTGELMDQRPYAAGHWSISVARDGEITLHLSPVPLTHDTTCLLTDVMERQRRASWSRLRATSASGMIESDHVTIHGRGTMSDPNGDFVTLQASPSPTRTLRTLARTLRTLGAPKGNAAPFA